MCYLRRRFEEQFADFAGRTYIGDTGAFYFYIRAEDVQLFLLKQTYKSFLFPYETMDILSCQICAVPDLCCIVSRRLVELVGGVFDPLLSSAIAVFEHIKDELAVIPCLLLATL